MKKILYLFCAAAIVFAACGKEETPDNTGNGEGSYEKDKQTHFAYAHAQHPRFTFLCGKQQHLSVQEKQQCKTNGA